MILIADISSEVVVAQIKTLANVKNIDIFLSMTSDLKSSLNALLDLFEKHNVRMRRQLNPPATNEQIDEFEALIGYELPLAAKALYLISNGQQSPFKVTYLTGRPNRIELPFPLEPDEWVSNLFGGYEFLSLEDAREEYSAWLDVVQGTSSEDFDEFVTVRPGDHVRSQYFNPGWVPIAKDGGGNAYALDLSPPDGGTYGQLIVIGPDEDQRRVLAPSLVAFFKGIAETATLVMDDGGDQRAFYNFG